MRKILRFSLAVALSGLCFGSAARADVKLPSVFSNHMVLQRGLPVPVWGWAEPGEEVTVKFAEQSKSAKADENGKWDVKLDALDASSTGRTMAVTGKNNISLQNVMFGDVWIFSGQSNMEWSTNATMNAQQEMEGAKFPAIRLFNVPGHITSPLPQENCPGNWQECTPQTVAGFSAVGYFFGRHLHQQTNTPIGLIGTNWGGTRIEPWTPPVGFRSVPQLKPLADQVDRFDPTTDAGKLTWENYLKSVENWTADARKALKAGQTPTTVPATPGYNDGGQPTAIYNAMVAPLAPYGVRGAIWYQGESNGSEGESYYHKMQALINGWRSVWNRDDNFPFYFYHVQLANWQQPTDNPAGGDGWAQVRDAQRKSLTIPHTGMAVTIDIGEAGDIHPRNKQDVGLRLAYWALRDVYQDREVVVSGPLYREMKIEGNKVRISFDHAAGDLMVGKKQGLAPMQKDPSGKLARFAIAGKDKQWHWAEATVEGSTVVVSSEKVPEPLAVRYAWSMNPQGANLYNAAGLPAAPFRTDDW